ncbi:MAG: TerB N-terminal domain-containing protein [Lachnospiraceae bacterium]|nr:TerB N-terminal domain-containing protein [Lachnospiraceae bacterium]
MKSNDWADRIFFDEYMEDRQREKAYSDDRFDYTKQGRAYTDEPIRLSPERKKSMPPKEYRQMRNLAVGPVFDRYNEAKIFYLQAKFMENFEDDCPYEKPVIHYFPTYQSLSMPELRGYFTWRTELRKGNLEKTSLSYAFLYVYELLHLIGSPNAEKGFEKLRGFYEEYRKLDAGIERYVKQWIVDYAIYYDLPAEWIRDFLDTEFEDALVTLQDCQTAEDEELFRAVARLSTYHLDKSRAYKLYPEELMHAVCTVYRKIDARYRKRYERPYTQKLYGNPGTLRYPLFRSAVFYNPKRIEHYEYCASKLQKYICEQNRWSLERGYLSAQTSRELGVFLRAADRLIREHYGVRPLLKPGAESKTVVQLLTEAITKESAEKKRAAKPKVEFDLSKLSGIRRSSDAVGERLMTEEERYIEEPAAAETDQEPAAENDCILSGNALRFMQLLLYGGDLSGFLSQNHLMASVLAESVNEDLFDEFADTVIEFDGDTPVIVEDYSDDLKGMIPS